MKSIYSLLLLFAFYCSVAKAQRPILISDDSMKFGNTSMRGYVIKIPEVNYDKTLRAWTKVLEGHSKSKLVTENNEMSVFGAVIKEISPNTVNIFSRMENADSTVTLKVAFEIKKDKYIDKSTGDPEFTNANKYLKDFARTQYAELAKEQASVEEKKLHELERQLSSLQREKTHLQKSIESEKNTINSENQNITNEKNAITSVSSEIADQNTELSPMEEGPVKKEKVNYISGLEKKKKKSENAIESSENRISKSNAEIDKASSEIPVNDKNQADLKDKIDKQKAVYQKYTDKIKTINSM